MNRTYRPARAVPLENALPNTKLLQAISIAFGRLQLRERTSVLRRLLVPVGPMALAVLAGGAFAKYVRQARSPRMRLDAEHVAHVTSAQVLELARYVEQSEPNALQQAMRIIARSSRLACTAG